MGDEGAELAAARADEMDADAVNQELSIARKAIGWWSARAGSAVTRQSGSSVGRRRRTAPRPWPGT
ncbi:hypothetical protein [Streptomyces ardesiacus]|uniref:hypothetical protein n=1 Tax=Streptomyces ardesiacus TaxID=285564 RepID=UPI0036336495